MTELCNLALKYATDKGVNDHSYTPLYSFLFPRTGVRSVLEIGIDSGASLRMWSEYWPDAEIWGLDIEESTLINEGKIHSLLCNQGDVFALDKVLSLLPSSFDIIVDDGSHLEEDVLTSFTYFFPLLKVKGLYIVEDVLSQSTTLEAVSRIIGKDHLLSQIETKMPRDCNRVIICQKELNINDRIQN